MNDELRVYGLHAGIVGLLLISYFVLPEYHSGNLARIMVLAVYAMGYNLLFGYTGLLSLGHALFFSSGMYGLGLAMYHMDFAVPSGILMGLLAALITSTVVGFLALRTSGVAFMIVTLMFAQAGYLTVLYFGEFTRGDEGFVLQQSERVIGSLDLTSPAGRYFAALLLFAICFFLIMYIVRSGFGLALIAIRENEERAKMLGYDVVTLKLKAVVISGVMSGAAGAAYALLFGYAGATFATVQYSIFPLLWVLLGGAGVTIGPLIGTIFMFYLIDYSSSLTMAYMLVAGVVLVLLTLYAPQGLAGELRRSYFKWLP
jgi:branched-chain amino acid transport system permease protein|tara:strand:+ start:5056 stop:6000 length:945 start_codon:yes stop_codon:yes gene_type:complete